MVIYKEKFSFQVPVPFRIPVFWGHFLLFNLFPKGRREREREGNLLEVERREERKGGREDGNLSVRKEEKENQGKLRHSSFPLTAVLLFCAVVRTA